ncbi:MAG: YebC/PmpR family DNA-binding transcriptional regulator [Candidatus Methylacidiphilales bacterium]|nr:YebC/PmpR family DNA-binding transcriptional regulator [Candidatus Methylacidiphilales bacterium]
MAGHSHWAKVKRSKGVADARRGKLFSRLSKEITVATRMGGGDPNFNPRLRQAIATARGESMPVDNIERAVKKGTGELEGEAYEELIYEGYAPGGVAVLVETTTDNKNRTAADVRAIFSKGHGNMGGAGSVSWMFHRKGLLLIEKDKSTEDAVLEATLDAGAEDVKVSEEGGIEVLTPPDKLYAVSEALKTAGIPTAVSKFTYVAENQTPVTDVSIAEQVLRLYETLDDHDDVQNVYANFDIPPEILAKLS